jgi:hypothetical protein
VIARLAPIVLAALTACGSSHESSTGTAAEHTAPAHPAPPAPVTGDIAMDLVHAAHATIDLDLPAGGSRANRVSLPPGHNVVFAVTHLGGPIGQMSLTLYDEQQTTIPVSSDSMVCAEPGCTFSVEVASSTDPRVMIATCTAATAMSLRLEARLK